MVMIYDYDAIYSLDLFANKSGFININIQLILININMYNQFN